MYRSITLAAALLLSTAAFCENAVAQHAGHQAAAKREFAKGDIRVVEPWARATPGGAKVGGAYFTITNAGKTADRLIGGSAAVSGAFEIHDMAMTDGVMRMRRLENGIELKPGETIVLKPGALHAMFIELKQPVVQGEKVKGTLVFEKAGAVEIEYDVAPIGAQSLGGAPAPAKGDSGAAPHKHH